LVVVVTSIWDEPDTIPLNAAIEPVIPVDVLNEPVTTVFAFNEIVVPSSLIFESAKCSYPPPFNTLFLVKYI
jgi:hypothetical protein